MFKKKYQQTTKKENLDTENLSNDIFLSQIKAKSKLKNQLARCFRQRPRIYDVFCFAKKRAKRRKKKKNVPEGRSCRAGSGDICAVTCSWSR